MRDTLSLLRALDKAEWFRFRLRDSEGDFDGDGDLVVDLVGEREVWGCCLGDSGCLKLLRLVSMKVSGLLAGEA